MNASLQQQLDSLWKGRHGDTLDETLRIYEELNHRVSEDHIQILKSFVDKDDLGFWMRELITVTLLEIGGYKLIPLGLEVLHINSLEEHDSDTLEAALTGEVEANPSNSRVVLEQIIDKELPDLHDNARWLLDFC